MELFLEDCLENSLYPLGKRLSLELIFLYSIRWRVPHHSISLFVLANSPSHVFLSKSLTCRWQLHQYLYPDRFTMVIIHQQLKPFVYFLSTGQFHFRLSLNDDDSATLNIPSIICFPIFFNNDISVVLDLPSMFFPLLLNNSVWVILSGLNIFFLKFFQVSMLY